MSVFICVEGFTLPCGFILKELCAFYPNGEFCHFMFRAPENQLLSNVEQRTVRYTTAYLNNLSFSDGELPYNCFPAALETFKMYNIYTYSDVGRKLLQNVLPTTVITNVQSLGFKMPSTLPDPGCCRVHNPRYCAKAKAIAIKDFVDAGFEK